MRSETRVSFLNCVVALRSKMRQNNSRRKLATKKGLWQQEDGLSQFSPNQPGAAHEVAEPISTVSWDEKWCRVSITWCDNLDGRDIIATCVHIQRHQIPALFFPQRPPALHTYIHLWAKGLCGGKGSACWAGLLAHLAIIWRDNNALLRWMH
jgi:hypothetical protein